MMLGVTIGVGSEWAEVALKASLRMEQMTGINCTVITDEIYKVDHPSWMKCAVVDHSPFKPYDSFMIFDADVICVKPWNPHTLFESMGRPFMAVPDTRDQVVWDECNALGISFPDVYVNGGLTIFGREHAPIWRNTFKHHPKCGRWLEQGALNLSLLNSGVEVCRLPRYFNVLMNGDRGLKSIPDKQVIERAINVHACGINGPRGIQRMQERYGIHHESTPVEA